MYAQNLAVLKDTVGFPRYPAVMSDQRPALQTHSGLHARVNAHVNASLPPFLHAGYILGRTEHFQALPNSFTFTSLSSCSSAPTVGEPWAQEEHRSECSLAQLGLL